MVDVALSLLPKPWDNHGWSNQVPSRLLLKCLEDLLVTESIDNDDENDTGSTDSVIWIFFQCDDVDSDTDNDVSHNDD